LLVNNTAGSPPCWRPVKPRQGVCESRRRNRKPAEVCRWQKQHVAWSHINVTNAFRPGRLKARSVAHVGQQACWLAVVISTPVLFGWAVGAPARPSGQESGGQAGC
jgi:hypothetical protein